MSIIAIFLYHYLHVTFQGGFLLVAILGSLRIIIDPTSAFYPVILMIGSIVARMMESEFASLAVVVLLVTSLVSEGFHPIPQEEVESTPSVSKEAQTRLEATVDTNSLGDETKSESKSPEKKAATETASKRTTESNQGAQMLRDSKEAARLNEMARMQERCQQLVNKK
ncbi:hypothetical protein EON65_04735 [archaeon]|nr:MAG: hypothetical protein EON65_04735 [archaeon]